MRGSMCIIILWLSAIKTFIKCHLLNSAKCCLLNVEKSYLLKIAKCCLLVLKIAKLLSTEDNKILSRKDSKMLSAEESKMLSAEDSKMLSNEDSKILLINPAVMQSWLPFWVKGHRAKILHITWGRTIFLHSTLRKHSKGICTVLKLIQTRAKDKSKIAVNSKSHAI